MNKINWIVLFALTAVFFGIASDANAWTRLGITEKNFTINGKRVFLYGISYYGALGADQETILQDLDDMQEYHFNWIRVWANWTAYDNDVSAVDGYGEIRPEYMEKLNWLIKECDRRGMIVDVTVSRGYGPLDKDCLKDKETLGRALSNLVTELKDYENWYLDMANERNVHDSRQVTSAELAELRKQLRDLDPKRLVTASFGGDLPREHVEKNVKLIGLDFITPHRPRHASSPVETKEKTEEYYAWMKDIGRTVPVHYQEPFRRGYPSGDWAPTEWYFRRDLMEAMEGGAAGWCFHNGANKDSKDGRPRRCFDLRNSRLFDQLDNEERAFVRNAVELFEPPKKETKVLPKKIIGAGYSVLLCTAKKAVIQDYKFEKKVVSIGDVVESMLGDFKIVAIDAKNMRVQIESLDNKGQTVWLEKLPIK